MHLIMFLLKYWIIYNKSIQEVLSHVIAIFFFIMFPIILIYYFLNLNNECQSSSRNASKNYKINASYHIYIEVFFILEVKKLSIYDTEKQNNTILIVCNNGKL